MAEKDNSTHTEPMTAEMQAAVNSTSGNAKAPAKRAAPKKGATTHKKSAVKKKAAPKKKSAIKKKAAPKKKSTVKKKAAPKKKGADSKPAISAKASAVTAAAVTTAAAVGAKAEPTKVNPEVNPTPKAAPSPAAGAPHGMNGEQQQAIRQKLVDLGVADPEEIGAVAHTNTPQSNRPFWIKAVIALLVIVGLYFYSKGGNDTSTTQLEGQPVIAPLEEGAQPDDAPSTQSASSHGAVVTTGGAASTGTTGNDAEAHEGQASAAESGGATTTTEGVSGVANAVGDGEDSAATTPTSTAAQAVAPLQNNYMPGYSAPNPWNPDFYPPFNTMNQVAPINPYYYPPVNMGPAFAPPPYYTYPPAPYYQPGQPAPAE